MGAETFYGRDGTCRDVVASRGNWDMVSIPCHTTVWLTEPVIGIPAKVPGQRGPAAKHEQVLAPDRVINVRERRHDLESEPLTVRDCERGVLAYDHAFAEVWTVRDDARCDETGKADHGLRAVKDLLVIRQETTGTFRARVRTAPITTDKRTLAPWRANRHVVERTIQDPKSDVGGDD